MKHERAERMLAVVLAAVLLAGCGAKPPPPESTAGGRQPAASTVTPGRSHLPESTPPDSMHATTFITEQYTLEKVVQAENGAIVRLNIHLPKLESDSADAARINAELARYYENDVLDYLDCPAAADPAAWDLSIEMNWEASWYDDCVSLVVSSCYGGTDVPFHDGWCFDFESGKQLTVTQMLERMGADPAALEEALYRDVKRRDEQDRQAACERGLLPPPRRGESGKHCMVGHAGRTALFAGRQGEHLLCASQIQRGSGAVCGRQTDHSAGCTAAATGLGAAGAG